MSRWAKVPSWWQAKGEFHEKIATSHIGHAIAALKIYICLCIRAGRIGDESTESAGKLQMSLSQLSTSVGVSKPLAISGVRLLENWGFITTLPTRPTSYEIVRYATPGQSWGKLPSSHLADGGAAGRLTRLIKMSNRARNTMRALQMYLYMISIRQRDTGYVKVSYDRMSASLGLDRNQVAQAITTLVHLDLVTVRHADVGDFSTIERPSNVYWIRGLAFKRPTAETAMPVSDSLV